MGVVKGKGRDHHHHHLVHIQAASTALPLLIGVDQLQCVADRLVLLGPLLATLAAAERHLNSGKLFLCELHQSFFKQFTVAGVYQK